MDFSSVLERAVADGLVAAALVDRGGNVVGLSGEIDKDEVIFLPKYMMHQFANAELSTRIFAGELLLCPVRQHQVAICVAKKQLFVVAVLRESTFAMHADVRDLRDEVARMLADSPGIEIPLPWNTGGGSGSGPAELPVIELGITVRRGKA